MRDQFYRLFRFFILLMPLLLIHCTPFSDHHAHQAIPKNSPYSLPAQAYLALAKKRSGEEQISLYLMAAGRYIDEGDFKQAERLLHQIQPFTPSSFNKKMLLLAKIEGIKGNMKGVLSTLAQIQSIQSFTRYDQAQYHELLAKTYQTMNHPAEAIEERIKLDHFLTDETMRSNNHHALWLSLIQIPKEELNTLIMESAPKSALKGWAMLAQILSTEAHHPHTLLTHLEAWKANFPDHPGQQFLPESLSDLKMRIYPSPRQVALLLPLTGLLAGPGLAVKEGFLAAYEASGMERFLKVKFYDTNRSPIAALYEQAYQEGSDFIIGPLLKTETNIVAELPHPVPTLLLNDAAGPFPDKSVFIFGLSPLLEAKQIAARAHQDGLSKALVIALSGPFGDDLVRAFNEQWQELGGKTVDTLRFSPTDNLYQALHLILKVEGQDKLKHREDFDVIILMAYPSNARQIKPILNYYYAGNVPVYAPSIVYGGNLNTMKDRDLNGIIFCDIPWVFEHHLGSRNWPESFNSYNRLYALGVDSFDLMMRFNALLLFPAIHTDNGLFYLNHQRIHHILSFGQFKNGTPCPL